MESLSDAVVARKTVQDYYHSYSSRIKFFLSLVSHILLVILKVTWLPVIVAILGLFSHVFFLKWMPWISDSSTYLSDVSFIALGVYVSIIVALIFKEEKIFGKSFFSIYWSLVFSTDNNLISPFASWCVAFFIFTLWRRIGGDAPVDLGLDAIFLFLCSVISSIVALAEVLRKREKLWLSYCKAKGYLAKSPFYKQYWNSNIRMFRKGVKRMSRVASIFKNSGVVESLVYLINASERRQSIYPDFDYFLDFLSRWPKYLDCDNDLIFLSGILAKADDLLDLLIKNGDQRSASCLMDALCLLMLKVEKSKPVKKSLRFPWYFSGINIIGIFEETKLPWRRISLAISERMSTLFLLSFLFSSLQKTINNHPELAHSKSINNVVSFKEEYGSLLSLETQTFGCVAAKDPELYERAILDLPVNYLSGLIAVFVGHIF